MFGWLPPGRKYTGDQKVWEPGGVGCCGKEGITIRSGARTVAPRSVSFVTMLKSVSKHRDRTGGGAGSFRPLTFRQPTSYGIVVRAINFLNKPTG